MVVNKPAEDDDWTSCIFNTSSTTVYPPNNASIRLHYNDGFEREFLTVWEMD